MKLTTRFLMFVFVLIPFQLGFAQSGFKPNVIILTASQVSSAVDIEKATRSATDNGARLGIVILDGREGPFQLTADDRSINIFVSNLILRGINQAAIRGCDDGLYFDDFPLKHITVSEMAFFCRGNGVVASGAFQNVTLEGNLFQARYTGISAAGASTNWKIKNNLILAGGDGIRLNEVEKAAITGNHISGSIGIALLRGAENGLSDNSLNASYQGILLGQETWQNTVQNNTILGVKMAGIALEPGVAGNKVTANRVLCGLNENCLTVDAAPVIVEMNIIAGNRP